MKALPCLVLLCCSLPALAEDGSLPVRIALEPAAMSGLPREAVDASAHGRALHCEGVDLVALLRLIVPGDARPARWLRQLESITVSPPRDSPP